MGRNNVLSDNQFLNLKSNGVPESAIPFLAAGAMYFEKMDGIKSDQYWKEKEFTMRDEFFVLLNSYLGMANIANNLPFQNEWRLKFDVSFLFFLKPNAQSAYSVDSLCEANCYADAFAVCRTMHSRLNLLMLFALKPQLFDDWLKNSKDDKYLDGKVRQELENRGVNTVEHFYHFSSEILHSQFNATASIGYFEEGLFPEIPAIKNQVYVTGKFILGMNYSVILHMISQDYEGETPKELELATDLFKWLMSKYLVSNRLEHLFTIVAEERHWVKEGKNKFKAGGNFDFQGFKEQVEKFHRSSGQQKTLSSKYNI